MLDIDLATIVAQIVNFLVLAVALYFLLFKPVVKRMEARAQEKEAILNDIREKETQAQRKLEEVEARLANLDTEIEARLQTAFEQAQAESEALLAATQEEAERILGETEIEAAKRQQQEVQQLQSELVDSILEISAQILSKTTPASVHDALVEELTAEIWDMGKRDMRQVFAIRDSLAERTPTVIVSSAKELSPDQQRTLIRTFSALADRNVAMEIELDPSLVAGLRVRMGDLVVENTLAMELNELRSEVAVSLEESIHDED